MADKGTTRVLRITLPSTPLREARQTSWTEELTKTDQGERIASGQGAASGRRAHPFNMLAVSTFKNQNVHHSTCIEAKRASTTGVGFQVPKVSTTDPTTGLTTEEEGEGESKAAEVLNPLCDVSIQDVLDKVSEDYWATGNGYLEVVREKLGGEILGLYHCPAYTVYVVSEDDGLNKHYETESEEESQSRKFARYGDVEFESRHPQLEQTRVTELIHFPRSSNLSRYYGFPDWLAAVSKIEIAQALDQERFDFFLNRGVPEFMLFILGQKLGVEDWETIESGIKANVGLGNSHKSMAVNLDNPEVKIQLEKLAMEAAADPAMFTKTGEALALDIVSAHRVPPLLAGIQIPGKLGATNELPNALMSFQVLVVGPAQHAFTTLLDSTLGNKELNGGLPLTVGDFKFKKITDQIDTAKMDTVSRMRTPVAAAGDRDIDEGLRD